MLLSYLLLYSWTVFGPLEKILSAQSVTDVIGTMCNLCTHVSGPDHKKVARPERFELPTLWFEALEAGNLNAFVCVA